MIGRRLSLPSVFPSALVNTGSADVFGILAIVQRFYHSFTWPPFRSVDWQSANGHQRQPNNCTIALINVVVMLDQHNIWKPPLNEATALHSDTVQ